MTSIYINNKTIWVINSCLICFAIIFYILKKISKYFCINPLIFFNQIFLNSHFSYLLHKIYNKNIIFKFFFLICLLKFFGKNENRSEL